MTIPTVRRTPFLTFCVVFALESTAFSAAPKPVPTKADISYGSHPHQLLDLCLPPQGTAPFPVVINLSGTSEQMNAVTEDGDGYLVGPLCETADTCLNKRLIVAFSMDKEDAYAMLVEVPAGLPADKSPTRHADYRFIGKPDEGMQELLMEQLKKDPNWY